MNDKTITRLKLKKLQFKQTLSQPVRRSNYKLLHLKFQKYIKRIQIEKTFWTEKNELMLFESKCKLRVQKMLQQLQCHEQLEHTLP